MVEAHVVRVLWIKRWTERALRRVLGGRVWW